MVDFCMSHAAVGQRSAHRPQCTHTSSSFTMTRPVCGSALETYSACCELVAGAFRRERSCDSLPFGAMVRQSTGQMSMHASHSMHSLVVNTVCTSQFKQRCTSRAACSAVNPSSTSILTFLKRSMSPTCGTRRRSAALYSFLYDHSCIPILRLLKLTPRGRRSVTDSAQQYLWIEIAA